MPELPPNPNQPLTAGDLALLETRRSDWQLAENVTYLNHGSFGPSPRPVQEARNRWSAQLEAQPMDFFVRRMEGHLDEAVHKLGNFVRAETGDLVFCDNATFGMNVIAESTPLDPGDEVLLTNHEYGAVLRIWRRKCRQTGARVVIRKLPERIASAEEICDEFLAAVSPRTRIVVVSHVTSPTALVLPVQQICERARALNVPVCIDGPHAPAMVPVDLRRIGCDYYTASCHKWLSAPFGTGFLYVARRRQQQLEPSIVSWGGSVSGRPRHWKDEFQWQGTRDPAGFLAVPAAIDFLENVGLERFRTATHNLARLARQRIAALTGLEPAAPDSPEWYGSMIALPLPPSNTEPPKGGQRDPLQHALWERFHIEVPVIHWQGQRLIRVSCHLYNQPEDIDRLAAALADLLPSG